MTTLLFLIALLLPVTVSANEIVLYPGQRSEITVGHGQLQIEHKGIIDVRENGSRLVVIGKKIGTTKVISSHKSTPVHVISQKNYKTFAKLQEWTKKKVGPQITIEDGIPTIAGKILILDDWLELKEVMHAQDVFNSQFHVDAPLEGEIRKEVAQTLRRHQLPFSDLVTEGTWKIYLGKQQNSEVENYKKILQPLGIQVASSKFVVSGIPMVEISIVAAEVNKRDMSHLGVSWPDGTVVQPFANPIIAKDSWSLTVHHMEENGWGKVLASPTLVTQSGEEATFHSGGEIPIRTATQFNTNVQWKKYGIMMKIKPLVDFKGNIDVLIECEVSMLDVSSTVDGAPGLLINRITSHFNLQESRTIALSGLIKEQWGKGRKGLPSLKDIPILGNLFSSQAYMNNRTELMFFVTPKIVH